MLDEEKEKKKLDLIAYEKAFQEKKDKIDSYKNAIMGEEIRSLDEKLSKINERSKNILFYKKIKN